MKTITKTNLCLAVFASLALGTGTALAQHEHHDTAPAKPHEEPATPAKAEPRVGSAYPLATCPVTGKKLGTMGDPVVKLYEGREVRFCCPACPDKFEKDLAANLAKLDEKMIKDQAPLYPLKTSVVTGKELPEKPFEFVYGNRLVRLGAPGEQAEFRKDAKKYLSELDKATIAEQGRHFPLTKCPVSGDGYGTEMGKPVDMVVGGRLIRLCCPNCKRTSSRTPRSSSRSSMRRKGDKEHSDPTPHKDHDDTKPHGRG